MASSAELLQAARGHFRSGQYGEAEVLYHQVLTLDPARAEAHAELGDVYRVLGRTAEARARYEQALRLAPDSPVPLNNLGTLLLLGGALAEAQRLLEHAVQLRPDHALAQNNLGTVLLKLGRFAEARTCFNQALKLQPQLAPAHYNLGTVLHREGCLAEAESALRRALRLKPDYAPAHYQLGVLLKDLLRLDEARDSLEQALRLRPEHIEALSVLAVVLALQGKMTAARAAMDRALVVQPSDALQLRAALLLPMIYGSHDELKRERERIDTSLGRLARDVRRIEDPVESVGTTAFSLAYQGENDRDLLAQLVAIYRQAAPELNYVAPHCRARAGPSRRDGRRPIRVGFLSAFFFRHTIGKLNLGFLRNLSRAHFSVTLLRFPVPDDDMARALAASADQTVTLPRKLELARDQIAALELDVLVYTDVGMDPLTYFLALARLAPVQCAAWGHPVTTGIPTIDYFLSSAALEPEDAAAHYTENLVRFERINTYYYEPKLQGPVKDCAALGLPEGVNLYVCTQSLFKLHPDFDVLLGRILRGDPQGRVVLLEGPCVSWKERLIERFRRAFPAEADRVVFLPRLSAEDFLHLQACVPVLLDTTRFGGGNTSLEAFAFGTPIVTGAGRLLRDRITAGCYRQMGIMDCIAESDDDYVRIALRLGMDADWRNQMRTRILACKHQLYEDDQAVCALEQFLLNRVGSAPAGSRSPY